MCLQNTNQFSSTTELRSAPSHRILIDKVFVEATTAILVALMEGRLMKNEQSPCHG